MGTNTVELEISIYLTLMDIASWCESIDYDSDNKQHTALLKTKFFSLYQDVIEGNVVMLPTSIHEERLEWDDSSSCISCVYYDEEDDYMTRERFDSAYSMKSCAEYELYKLHIQLYAQDKKLALQKMVDLTEQYNFHNWCVGHGDYLSVLTDYEGDISSYDPRGSINDDVDDVKYYTGLKRYKVADSLYLVEQTAWCNSDNSIKLVTTKPTVSREDYLLVLEYIMENLRK